MFPCPSCHQATFRWRDKYRAERGLGLICAHCKASSWMQPRPADGRVVAAVLLSLLAGLAALAWQSPLPWAAALLLWGLLRAWRLHRKPLLPAPPLKPTRAQRAGALESVSLLSLILAWF